MVGGGRAALSMGTVKVWSRLPTEVMECPASELLGIKVGKGGGNLV